uniref:CASP-like protein 4B1 isoform X2 n=1 Tax=Erigeron canadensis TaxID=72917 RepID=UPI001CB8E759|nr:CASP-like protein 4B1 isoform X2 [Erigeron canadensis]
MSSFSSSPPPAKLPTPTAPSGTSDIENDNTNNPPQTPLPPPPGFGVTGILRRWRHEDMFIRVSLGLRTFGFVFSLLAFIIMASNKHGRGRNFDEYEEYRYVLAIAILATLYTGLQSWRQIHEMSTGKQVMSRKNMALIDFFGDQNNIRQLGLLVFIAVKVYFEASTDCDI